MFDPVLVMLILVTVAVFAIIVVAVVRTPHVRGLGMRVESTPLFSQRRSLVICPACKRPSMDTSIGMEFPPDGSSDEVTLGLLECASCGLTAASLYEESRRGSLDRESFHHWGWPIARVDFLKLEELMRSCSKRNDPRCTCRAHTVLGKRNESSAWDGLRQNGYELGEWFRVEFADEDAARV